MLPPEFLEQIGAPNVPEDKHEVYRAEMGNQTFIIRRDCHGVLRRLEVTFAEEDLGALRERLSGWGDLQVVVPGALEWADVPGVARLYLTPGRLHATLRFTPDPVRLQMLLDDCLQLEG